MDEEIKDNDIAGKADRMLARNNMNSGLTGEQVVDQNNEDFDEGNIEDVDENEGNVSADANMNILKSQNRDENGLPMSLSKNVGKLPPLTKSP